MPNFENSHYFLTSWQYDRLKGTSSDYAYSIILRIRSLITLMYVSQKLT